MQRHVDILLTKVKATTTGLLQPWWPPAECSGGLGNICFWNFLGDWLAPFGGGSDLWNSSAAIFFNSCYLTLTLRRLAGVAGALQDAAGQARYTAAADSLASATHLSFWNGSSYLDGRQGRLSVALVAGVTPAALRPAVLRALIGDIEARGHFDTGLFGTLYVTQLLSDPALGRQDLLHALLTAPTPPSHAALLSSGRDTFPEAWDPPADPGAALESRAHSTLLGPALWFPRGVLGVRQPQGQPGGAVVHVRPAYGVGGLSAAQGAVWTALGAVQVAWTLQGAGGVCALELSISPAGGAHVWVLGGNVSEGGQPARQALGVAFVRVEGNSTVWAVGSGSYSFVAQSSRVGTCSPVC
jgi:alpha-L-rhamnosidase